MKIIICANTYPPNFIGGAELIAHYQAKMLQLLGHEVIIFAGELSASGERYSLRQEAYDGLTVYRVALRAIDYDGEYNNFAHPQIDLVFNELLDAFAPDIVHFHNMIGLSIGMIHAAKRSGIKTVLTVHDHWGFCQKNTRLKSTEPVELCQDYSRCAECRQFFVTDAGKPIPIRLRQDILSLQIQELDALIAPSRYLADAYIQAGVPAEKVRHIWNGIEVARFARIAKIPMKERVRFTFIGYMASHKGIQVLLDALPRFSAEVLRRVRINLVGFGEFMESYRQQVEKMGLNHIVKFWGKVDNIQIEQVYQETDVLILPSIWPENQPVTITEAMTAKIPAIGSRIGGIPELIDDGQSGYLFEPGNAEQLAQKMSEFIADPGKIQQFGEQAYHKIHERTFENQVRQIVQLYDQLPLSPQSPTEYHLIVCLGEGMNSYCVQALTAFLKKPHQGTFRFVMADWISDVQYSQAKLLWIVDAPVELEKVLPALHDKIPLLCPDDGGEIRILCSDANCGLYYANAEEAEACLTYLLNHESIRSKIGGNGHALVFSGKFAV